MKKIIILLFGVILLLSGCNKKDLTLDVKNAFIKEYEKKNTYLVKVSMDIISNEDTFSYNVVAAKDKELYRVNLTNTINNHEQVILRSEDGVYVQARKSCE